MNPRYSRAETLKSQYIPDRDSKGPPARISLPHPQRDADVSGTIRSQTPRKRPMDFAYRLGTRTVRFWSTAEREQPITNDVVFQGERVGIVFVYGQRCRAANKLAETHVWISLPRHAQLFRDAVDSCWISHAGTIPQSIDRMQVYNTAFRDRSIGSLNKDASPDILTATLTATRMEIRAQFSTRRTSILL